jgi:hypothetical protein
MVVPRWFAPFGVASAMFVLSRSFKGGVYMRLIIFLLVINAVCLLSAVYLILVEPFLSDVELRMRYTSLDRAQAINQDKLADFDSSLAANDRNNVPRWMAAHTKRAQWRNALMIGCLSLVNTIITGILVGFDWRKRERR